MKYRFKIKYNFFGGAEQNVNYIGFEITFSNEQLNSYQRSNYRHIPNDEENIDIYKQYFRFNLENLLVIPCVTVRNGGYVQQNRNNIVQTNTSYSNQCMYISIYDYLTLKLRETYNFTFEEFRRQNDINTSDEFDSTKNYHKDNLTRLASKYNLDIRVWDKDPQNGKRIYYNNNNNSTQNVQANEYGIEHITYNFRRGAGNPNIVNILSYSNHFELIVGGSDFLPLFEEQQFNNFHQDIRASMSHYTDYVVYNNNLVNMTNMPRANTEYDYIFARNLQEEYDRENLDFINKRNNGIYTKIQDYYNDDAMALRLQEEENENHLRSLLNTDTDNDLALALSLEENENTDNNNTDNDLALALRLQEEENTNTDLQNQQP